MVRQQEVPLGRRAAVLESTDARPGRPLLVRLVALVAFGAPRPLVLTLDAAAA